MEEIETQQDEPVQASEPIRPVLFAGQFGLAQSRYTIRRLLSGLVGSAHGAALVSSGQADFADVLAPTVEFVEYPMLKLPLFRVQNRRILLDRLSRFKPTVLHGFWPDNPELVSWVSRKLGVPYVLSFYQRVSKISRLYLDARHASALVAPFQYIADDLAHQWPYLKDRVRLIEPGCYVEDQCACFDREDQNASLILIQPLERLTPLEPLLQAVRHLALDGFEFALGIIGTGPAEMAVRRRIRALGLMPVVTLVPELKPMRSLLEGCDIFIHLENSAACNMAMLEAMSLGVAVAGTSDPGQELLKDQQTAAVFETDDEIQIYGTLKKLLTQREWTRQLALEGQVLLRKNHRVSQMLESLTQLYRGVQENHQPDHQPQPA